MSGICGIVNFDGAPVEIEVLQKMAGAASHRGPDGIRYWGNGSTGLANLALNITPESLREKQPLASRRGDFVLTADARVDNRNELIRTLTSKGYLQDREPTDAEIILAAYECWGEGCPVHIIGDFAFVVWDARRRRLFAAREPMGTRALYYRVEPRRILFATEVKQILAAPGVPASIFEPAVGAFLTMADAPPEWTYYEGIVQLPPAHALAVDATGGHRAWRYWDIDPDFRIEYATEHQYAEHFREIFTEAVRCRLRSVKPVGIFLSGGMDSGSVASTAGWLLEKGRVAEQPEFRAYCWAFERFPQSDERHISDSIVHHYGLPVTYIPAETAWPLKDYPAHGPDQDDPYLPFFRVLADRTLTEARAEGMGSMLTGGLGDLIVGSQIFDYLDQLLAGQWRRLWYELQVHGRLSGVRRRMLVQRYMWSPLANSLWPARSQGLRQPLHRLLGHPPPYPEWIRPEFARRVGLTEIVHHDAPQTPVRGFARRERYRAIFSPGSTQDLIGWERSNALFGLGDADPFSDRRVASFVLAVPQRVLTRAGELKLLLRRSMWGVMPEDVRRAAGKIQPYPLVEAAIKQYAQGTVLNLVTKPRAEERGYIDGQVLANHLTAYNRGEQRRLVFWFTLALEMWLRRHWS